MTKPSLRHLYRCSNANLPADAIDAETLVRSASGTLPASHVEAVAEVLATSTAHADLVRTLRSLEPVAAAFARDLALVHEPRRTRNRDDGRRAAGTRRTRHGWHLGAIAACLMAGVALWTNHAHHASVSDDPLIAGSVQGDVIFSTTQLAQQPQDDVIFRSVTVGDQQDRIFHGNLRTGS